MNTSRTSTIKVMPYCQDAMSSCGLFAWGNADGINKYAQPKSFVKPNPPIDGDDNDAYKRQPNLISNFFATDANPFGTPVVDTGIIGESSSGGSGGIKISADTINAALGTATGVLQLLGNKKQLSEVETVCGKQPKPLIGGAAKKAAWATCASNYMQSKLNANKPKAGISGTTWAIIGVGSAAFLVIGFLVIKNLKPKQVVQTIPIAK